MFDVTVTRHIAAAPEKVAAIMFDPGRDAEWLGGVKSVTMLTVAPYDVGTRIRREGVLLGRKIVWMTETTVYDPGEWTEMCVIEGPFSGDIEYRIEPEGDGARVFLINRGSRPGLPDFLSAIMVWMRAKADLKRLALLVEGTLE